MNKVLVVIDAQNDFIDGPLGTPEARRIIDKICEKIEKYHKDGDEVLVTMDTHSESYLYTPEGKSLPIKHCVLNTNGWKLNDRIAHTLTGGYRCYRCFEAINKTSFASKFLADSLKEEHCVEPIDEIELIGVCTDICVIANALMLKNEFHNEFTTITVDASCCAGTTPERHRAALEVMKSCQINVINE